MTCRIAARLRVTIVLAALAFIAIALQAQAARAQQQTPSRCVNRLCMAAEAIVQAVIRLERERDCPGTQAILLRDIRSSPVPSLRSGPAPVILRAEDLQLDHHTLRTPAFVVHDSASAFTLPPMSDGVCVFATAPPAWLGPDRAYLHIFVHRGRFGEGEEYFVDVEFSRGLVRDVTYRPGRLQRVQR